MFGSHLSIAGGLASALLEAERLGLQTVQIFTKNQQQWAAPPLDPSAAQEWIRHARRLGWGPQEDCPGRLVAHASYLINLATPDPELWKKSVALMRDEIERCEALGIAFLVHHPGSATDGDPAAGIERIARAYGQLLSQTQGYRTVMCLENTVGAGRMLGGKFEELAQLRRQILQTADQPARVGFCFDTCHAHAAGYSMTEKGDAHAVLQELDRTCGLAQIRVVHVNDSKAKAGSRRDLHEHIGEGTIGRRARPKAGRAAGDNGAKPVSDGHPTPGGLAGSGFAAVVKLPAFAGIPKILETPKGTNPSGRPYDALNVGRLRRLIGQSVGSIQDSGLDRDDPDRPHGYPSGIPRIQTSERVAQ